MSKRRVWQIAGGSDGRDYSRLFRDYDLMFMGPGLHGPFDKSVYDEVVATKQDTKNKIGMVRSFATRVADGDIVLARVGHRVIALGVAVDEDDGSDGYCHDTVFDDVYGWSLEHTRRVLWQTHLDQKLATLQADRKLFAAYKQQPTFTRVHDDAALQQIAPLLEQIKRRPLKPRPAPLPEPLELDELGEKLFAQGLANDAVDKVISAITRQRRLLKWYRTDHRQSKRPDEHEIVAHLVLPLLLALGWSEQLLAIEWRNVDLAAFGGTPTTPERCVLVCEAKGMRYGLQGGVWKQAIGYARKLELVNCRKILATQGARFYLYERPRSNWPDGGVEPTGYINLERIRENHIAPSNTNAVRTIMALTPAGMHGG